MQHLFSITVYHSQEELEYLLEKGLKTIDSSGIELLVGYDPVDVSLKDVTRTVHLPYAVDWFGPYSGRRKVPEGLDQISVKYQHYGRDRSEIIDSVCRAIDISVPLEPEHGVFHASSADMDSLMTLDSSDGNENIVSAVADIMNEIVSVYPGGEPPFKLVFENTWWPGLRMIDDRTYRVLENELEFSNWGLCLDTGHLLVSLRGSDTEESALEMLNECVESYPKEMIERIDAMHLHVNTSKSVLLNVPSLDDSLLIERNERIKKASELISSADMHLPFTNAKVKDFVNRINPQILVHEMGAINLMDNIRDYNIQRSLL